MLRTTESPCGGFRYMWGGIMGRVAVFVDAGYLFAAGSAALTGSKKPRQHLTLLKSAVIEKLKLLASEKAPNAELLRIYWYDGADGYKGQTSEQVDLAYRDDIKIRLGFINSHGQQKGVDSLIVTDLIELARNRSICDAVLISGDEDVRVGVQMAQNFGVRVHLVGIVPCRASQSNLLMQEADTCSGWEKSEIKEILEYQDPAKKVSVPTASTDQMTDVQKITKVVEGYITALSAETLLEVKAYIKSQKGIPPDHDGRLLAECREQIGRALNTNEKREMRTQIRSKLMSRN